jgi:hypothetical protein
VLAEHNLGVLMSKESSVELGTLSDDFESHACEEGANTLAPRHVLRLAGFPAFRNDSAIPVKLITIGLWSLYLVVLCCLPYVLCKQDGKVFFVLSNILWMTHSLLIYTIIAHDFVYRGGSMMEFVTHISECKERESRFFNDFVESKDKSSRNILIVNNSLAIYVVIGVIANVFCVANTYVTNSSNYDVIPLTKDLWWSVTMACVWYFYSFGWYLSAIFICIPTYVLLSKINAFLDHISAYTAAGGKSVSVSSSALNMDQVMGWYDDLHRANKEIVSHVSLFLTLNIFLCAPNTVLIMEVKSVIYAKSYVTII